MKIFSNVKRLLINVDMVNGFVNEGPMHDSYINHIVPMQTIHRKQSHPHAVAWTSRRPPANPPCWQYRMIPHSPTLS